MNGDVTIVDHAGDARIWVRGVPAADDTALTLEDFRGVVRIIGSDFTVEAEGRILLAPPGTAPPFSKAPAGTGCATTAGAAGPTRHRRGLPRLRRRSRSPPPGPAPPGPGRAQARSTASATCSAGTRYSPRAIRRRSDSRRAARSGDARPGKAPRVAHTENRTTITSPSAIT